MNHLEEVKIVHQKKQHVEYDMHPKLFPVKVKKNNIEFKTHVYFFLIGLLLIALFALYNNLTTLKYL